MGKSMRLLLLFVMSACGVTRPVEDMVFVRGGLKLLGCPTQRFDVLGIRECMDRTGARRVFPPLLVDRDPVDGLDYQRCVEDGACPSADPPRGGPVVTTFTGARQYCSWRRARLPTSDEWETIARSGTTRLFPWGDEPILDSLRHFHDVRDITEDGVRGMHWALQWVDGALRHGDARPMRGGSHVTLLHDTAEMPESTGVPFRCVRDLGQ